MAEAALPVNRWNVVYPVYINEKKKISEGRRLGKDLCVDRPSVKDIGWACQQLGLQHVLETDKAYSRDFREKGRVRVQTKNAKGERVLAHVANTSALFASIAEAIRKNPNRHMVGGSVEDAGSGVGGSKPVSKKKKKNRR